MLAGVWLVYLCFGMAVYSTAPLVGPIRGELELSLSAMGAVMGAWPLVYIAMAAPAGAVLDRFGVRRSLAVAMAVITISLTLRAASTNFVMLFVAVALFGIGGPLVSVGAPKLIASWFDSRERGIAIGVYSTGPTLGAVLVLSLTNSVLMPATGYSWRLTLLALATLTATVGVIWFLIANHASARGPGSDGSGRGSLAEQLAVFRGLLELGAVRLVLGIAVGVFMFNHAFNNWLPEILRATGMDAVRAGFWASVPSLIGTAAALVLPRYAVEGRRAAMLIGAILIGALAAVVIAYADGALLVAGLCLQGVARGAMIPITMLTLMETREVDSKVMGAAGGLFFAAAETGGVMGPLMTGWLADTAYGFDAALVTLAGVCLVCAALAAWLARLVTLHRH